MNKVKLQKILNLANSLLDSIRFIYQNDINNIWRFSSYQYYFLKYNQLAKEVEKEIDSEGLIDIYDTNNIPSWGKTIAMQQKIFLISY